MLEINTGNIVVYHHNLKIIDCWLNAVSCLFSLVVPWISFGDNSFDSSIRGDHFGPARFRAEFIHPPDRAGPAVFFPLGWALGKSKTTF